MGKIPADYLPPKEFWPEHIVPDEFKSLVAAPAEHRRGITGQMGQSRPRQ